MAGENGKFDLRDSWGDFGGSQKSLCGRERRGHCTVPVGNIDKSIHEARKYTHQEWSTGD